MELDFFPSVFSVLTLAFLSPYLASASQNPLLNEGIRCYQVRAPQSPARMDPLSIPGSELSYERWCYQDFSKATEQGLQRGRLVFQSTDARFHPELAAWVTLSASGEVESVKQQVLNQKNKSSHKRWLTIRDRGFNPLPVPLVDEESRLSAIGAQLELTDSLAFGMDSRFRSDAILSLSASVLADGIAGGEESESDSAEFTTGLQVGSFHSDLPSSEIPWKGYWWPFQDYPLANGDNSPMGKYDRIVHNWTGTDPQSHQWEAQNHSLDSVAWGGHCNGWAAASILYPEPRHAVRDPATGITLSVTDQKGLLTEASFCVNFAFYGTRYYSSSDDLTDIHADLFHRVLTYYIDGQQHPIAMDYENDEKVDNHVITGYDTKVEAVPGDAHRFHVRTTLHMHKYDLRAVNTPGASDAYNAAYEYYLTTDSTGAIASGQWVSQNPDFMWVPLSQKYCAGENPRLDPDSIVKMINTLPSAENFRE